MEVIAIFSDIHANHKNLLQALPKMQKSEARFFLGDALGYRKHPARTVELLRDNTDIALQGNHDAAATGQFDEFLHMIPPWLEETLLEAEDLSEGLFSWIATRKRMIELEDMTMVHGSLRDPLMEFLTPEVALENFALQKTPLLLAGHTHKALAIGKRGDEIILFVPSREKRELDLAGAEQWILNPGSLGVARSDPSWLTLSRDKALWNYL